MVSNEGIVDKDLRASFFDMAYSPFVILNFFQKLFYKKLSLHSEKYMFFQTLNSY